MFVRNEIYFHIRRFKSESDKWEPGSRINWINRELNYFNNFWETHSYFSDIGDAKNKTDFFSGLTDYLRNLRGYRKKQHEEMLKKSENIIRSYCMFTREMIFEEVRKEFFPCLPSRRTCIWVMERHSIEGWWGSFRCDKQLLELGLTGNLHKGDNKYLKIGTFSHDTYRENAFKYWTGSDGNKPEEEECIFEGMIEIMKEHSNLADIQ